MTEEQAFQLDDELKENWWQNNQYRFLKKTQ